MYKGQCGFNVLWWLNAQNFGDTKFHFLIHQTSISNYFHKFFSFTGWLTMILRLYKLVIVLHWKSQKTLASQNKMVPWSIDQSSYLIIFKLNILKYYFCINKHTHRIYIITVLSLQTDDPDRVEKAKVEAEKIKKLQNLFKGLKFFLNREVPRETLVFIIR